MARTSRIAFSNQHSRIRDVEKYYVDSEVALNLYFSPSSLNTFPARFIGYSITEFDDELKIRKEALDKMCSLEILAAIEAKFRIDYLNRCQNKEKDDLSKKFRQIHKFKKNKALLVDDIFANWKQIYPEHKSRLDGLGKAFDFRNWLAHGKYWVPKKIHTYINTTIYQYIQLRQIYCRIWIFEAFELSLVATSNIAPQETNTPATCQFNPSNLISRQ